MFLRGLRGPRGHFSTLPRECYRNDSVVDGTDSSRGTCRSGPAAPRGPRTASIASTRSSPIDLNRFSGDVVVQLAKTRAIEVPFRSGRQCAR